MKVKYVYYCEVCGKTPPETLSSSGNFKLVPAKCECGGKIKFDIKGE